eukprot:588765_1
MFHSIGKVVARPHYNIYLKRTFSSYWQRLRVTLPFSTQKSNVVHQHENTPNSVDKLQDTIDSSQHSPYDISNVAMQYHLANDTDTANALYLSSLSNDKKNGDLNFYYAHFLFHCQQNYDSSLKYAKKAIDCKNTTPPHASPYILLAQAYGMKQKTESAQKYFDIAVQEIGDDNCNAYFNYAQTLNMLKDYPQCIQYLNQCMQYLDQSNPYHPTPNEIHTLMNSCYVELKQYANAIQSTKQLTNIDTFDNLSILYEYLNRTQEYRDDPEHHEAFYINDLKQNENDFYCNVFYAKHLISKQKFMDALQYLDKAKDIDPQHYVSYYYKAIALFFGDRDNHVDDIMQLFEHVIDTEPTEIACYAYLSNLYQEIDEPLKALECLEKGMKVDSNTNVLYFNYAMTLLSLDRIDEYRDAMAKTISICKRYSSDQRNESAVINPQLFYTKNDICNLHNAVHSTIEVCKEFGDYYLNAPNKPVYKSALRCYVTGLDESAKYRDYGLEEYLFTSVATCYLNIKGEHTNMKRYCLMGLNKYPQSLQLNFLYSQYLFRFAQSYVLALKYLDITMQLDPDNIHYHLIKANIYHNRLYDNPKAIECVQYVMDVTDEKDPLYAQARECLFQFTSAVHVVKPK